MVAVFVAAFVGAAVPLSRAGRPIEKNKAMSRRVFDDILNRDKYDVFAEIYAESFVKHVDRKDYTLAQEIQQAKSMRTTLSDLVMTVDQMIAEGDYVAILYTGRGTSTGPFGGMPATGNKVVASGATTYRFSKGKIVEEWTTYNMLDILQQLGYYPGKPIK